MTTPPTPSNRRHDVRLASRKPVDAVIEDQHGQPIDVLKGAEVLNVSAGGLAMISDQPAVVGSQLKVIVDLAATQAQDDPPIRVSTLDCQPMRDHRYKIRCRLISGMMPARLIYGW